MNLKQLKRALCKFKRHQNYETIEVGKIVFKINDIWHVRSAHTGGSYFYRIDQIQKAQKNIELKCSIIDNEGDFWETQDVSTSFFTDTDWQVENISKLIKTEQEVQELIK